MLTQYINKEESLGYIGIFNHRRQDAIGTPFCITVDHQTLEDNTVTLRERDSMAQTRVNIDELHRIIHKEVSLNALLRKLG